MDFDFFEECYRIINRYNKKTAKPQQYGTKDMLYPAEVHLINTIGNHEKVTVTELAALFGITKGAVSQTTSKLVKKQLIEKTPSENEKNVVFISLSEKGRIVYDYHCEMHRKSREKIDMILGNLSPQEQNSVKEIITALDEMLDDM